MTTVHLEGLVSNIPNEDRALANIRVEHNGETYYWQAYIPPNVDIAVHLEASAASIGAEIDAKEAEWAAHPKTKEVETPMGVRTFPVEKSEIVCPSLPDYYAKRRAEYPSTGDQLDAMWKGGAAVTEMQAKIAAVKQKYPKP